jgi:hypothetical protein
MNIIFKNGWWFTIDPYNGTECNRWSGYGLAMVYAINYAVDAGLAVRVDHRRFI